MSIAFYVGLHQPSDAARFSRACISIRRLWTRRKPIPNVDVLIDSGAFTELNLYGAYRDTVETYAAKLFDLHTSGVVKIAAAVAQDYMCEPFILRKTGLTVAEHQSLTIERYDKLLEDLNRRFDGAIPFHVLPVIQGFRPSEYAEHVLAYGDRFTPGMWVGVGSVCKRQGDPTTIVEVLSAIASVRPDLSLHGFGVKQTALLHPGVRELLSTADSMAWSFAARRQGRDANAWSEAQRFVDLIDAAAAGDAVGWQMPLPWWREAAE